jgi:integral membrane sensor domain MASE1
MARFIRPSQQRGRRGVLFHPGTNSTSGKAVFTWWVVAAIGLLLVAVPILVFNQQHSGDGVKIRRELRKF